MKSRGRNGFTLLEVLVVLAILILAASVLVAGFNSFKKSSELVNSRDRVARTVRLARNLTLASKDSASHGVFFDTSASPHQMILFKGPDYDGREVVSDEVYPLSKEVELFDIDLSGGEEVVFEELTGEAVQEGSLKVGLRSDPSLFETVYVSSSGEVGFSAPSPPSEEGLIRDSRHVHIDYSRGIDTAGESILLEFQGDNASTTEEVIISENISEGQIDWQGEVEVDGESQEMSIRTVRLNDPGTEFCIHRDMRRNSKGVTISLSGDSSGSLIYYSADGLSIGYSSIYVNEVLWQ